VVVKTKEKTIQLKSENIFTFLILFSQFSLSIMNHRIAMTVQLISIVFLSLIVLRRKKTKTSSFMFWYLILIFISAISCYLSLGSLSSNLLNMFQLLVVIFLLDQVVNDRANLDFVVNCYIFSCIVVGLWLMFTSGRAGDSRLGMSVSNSLPIWIGSFSSLSFCLSIYLAVKNKGSRLEKIYFISAAICFVVLFFTGSRKYYISVLGALLFFILNRKKGRIKRVTISIFVVVVFVYLIFNNSFLYGILGRRIDKLMSYVNSSSIQDDKSAFVREMFIRTGWEAFKNKPIFGHGMWSWNSVTNMGTHPHNNYIDLLFSLGLFGCAYYYLFILNIWRRLWSINKENVGRIFFIISILLILVMDYFQRSFCFDPVIIFLYFAYLELEIQNNRGLVIKLGES